MAAFKALPLSYNWTVKEVMDEVRSVTKEEDEQIVSDDNIRGHLQWAIHQMFKVFPTFKFEYLVEIPFVTNYTDYVRDPTISPMIDTNTPVSTLVRPSNSASARPIKIIGTPDPTQTPTLLSTGVYDFHYQHPQNCTIIGWWDMRNDLTGSVRRTSDYTQLMGHSLNNNTQLARTSAYYNQGRHLWVSVREGMIRYVAGGTTEEVIHVGIGWRTPLMLVRFITPGNPVPTGNIDDTTTPGVELNVNSPTDESTRYIPVVNDWEKIDCPDDFVPMAIQLCSIKVWSQVGKITKEQESAQVETAYAGFLESSEGQLLQRQTNIKDTQWKDRGHQ